MIILNDLDQTALEDCARHLVPYLNANDIIYFQGDLGAGKSTFIRALIRQCAKNDDLIVPSPTFTLIQAYDDLQPALYHLDLYRLDHVEALYELGLHDLLISGALLVEWPDLMQQAGFVANLTITIKELPTNTRQITLAGDAKFLQQ